MTCSLWIGEHTTLIEGTEHPRFANGEIDDPGAVKIAEFEGADWNECATKYHEHMGWEPYKPMDAGVV